MAKMISYAQNCEDVVLNRVFLGQATGVYVDVGAWDPVHDSVTKHFYDRGWRGINIEPVDYYYQRLLEYRPRDTNLQAAVAAGSQKRERFVSFADTGLSGLAQTLNRDTIYANQAKLEAVGVTLQETIIDVEVVPLAEITSRYAPPEVDFLKIDVEGAERSVIESAEWRAFRPRVIVVEAVTPLAHKPAWFEWEGLLFEAGYEFALFDGLNRFYYRAEEPALREPLSVPANVLDGYMTSHFAALRHQVAALEAAQQAPPLQPAA